MSEAVKQRTMTEGRALLTEREKEALAGDGSDSYRYKTRTYFRSRLEKLEGDVDMLAEHDPELLDELRDVVCPGDESAPQAPRERSASQADGDTTADEEHRDAAARAESEGANTAAKIVDSCSFDRDLTSPRRRHLEAWIQHVANVDGGVQNSDFEAWWTDERAGETGYNAGSFWEAFAKATMKQSDRFTKPNTRTYRFVGESDT